MSDEKYTVGQEIFYNGIVCEVVGVDEETVSLSPVSPVEAGWSKVEVAVDDLLEMRRKIC